SSSIIMALRISQAVHILLLLSLILLVFHEYYNLKSKINKKQITQTSHYSLLPSHHHFMSRKFLATKFDFSPFFRHHHKHHQPGGAVHHDPSDTEIDPRYGVEKRRVPTGPNPLHH
ncbi:CLAVATA3/ESR (CLE)-related protein 12, partial [Glycine soja]